MLFSDESNKINFNEILTLGKFNMTEEELTKTSLILTKVYLNKIGFIIKRKR
jgi:hypothetical protein